MRERICRVGKLFLGIVLGLTLVCSGIGTTGMCAHAMNWLNGYSMDNTSTELPLDSSMDIQAKLLTSDKSTYQIQVTVENFGMDWEGTVRLKMGKNYRVPTAYDTVLSLPQGSTKQFVVKVPRMNEDWDGQDIDIRISLWNKKNVKVAEREYPNLLLSAADAFEMGILSDDYSALTYLDLGGQQIYFNGMNKLIRLTELNQDNLTEKLSGLTLLVIDHFHTDILTQKDVEAIEDWVADGGVLLVGTGTYAEETLPELCDGFLEVTYRNSYHSLKDSYAGYYYYTEDLAELSCVELAPQSNLYGGNIEDYGYTERYFGGFTRSYGNGAIAIMPYSLVDLAKMNTMENFEFDKMIYDIINEITSLSHAGYGSTQSYSYEYTNTPTRLLGMLGNGSRTLKFGVLKLLIIAYVIFVGPVLYLILRARKKRDLYWVFVPVSALVGVFLISFAGRGFEVADTRVYSVTMTNVDTPKRSKTLMHCYNANHREWDLQLAGRYEYVGPVTFDYYYSYYYDDKYFYHIRRDGDKLFFGIAPESNFEDCYFITEGASMEEDFTGSLVCEGVGEGLVGLRGTVTNATDRDLIYVAVIVDNSLYVYDGLTAGASMDLMSEPTIHQSGQYGNIWSGYIYQFINDRSYNTMKGKDLEAAAALGIGIGAVYPQPDESVVLVIGVANDWSKAVDDRCSETAYGCLYQIQ